MSTLSRSTVLSIDCEDRCSFSLLKKKQTGSTLLLLGISDAGKTAMYTQLRFGKKASTVTSIKENEGPITLFDKTFDLVDMPGHERVRYRFADYLPVTRAIVFVVDSSTVNRSIRSVAEYLYNILSNPQTQKQRIPVLIACNKADKVMALPKQRIQQLLEAEMNRLRATRTAAVDQQASEMHEQEAFLGYEDEDLQFAHLENDVSFETCSVEKEEMDEVTEWLRTAVFA
ncbi:hypothetical protein DFQ28_010671 [Apophysomyces sp. BC1034]|nr:hypothetical protein DFQ28_010671 [Apophysomyces sp. BC1034]